MELCIQIGILLTLAYLLYKFKRDTNHYLLLSVLLLFSFTELITFILLRNDINHNPAYNISLIIHTILWLRLLFTNSNKPHLFLWVSFGFLILALIDMFLIEGWGEFNAYSLLAGALIYLCFFIVVNVQQFKRENFDFLTSNENLMLYTPLFLFITITTVAGFHDNALYDIELIKGIPLYTLVNTFGNLLYYGFINLYIYRANKPQYA